MSLTNEYLDKCLSLLETVRSQEDKIQRAAKWFSESILNERAVHLFGSGHSRIMVEEMWPRYGSFPGFNPIVELALTNHNNVVGANGQRQAMFLENVEGFAKRILRNFSLSPLDCALIISSSGCNIVPVEMAEEFQKNQVKVVALVSSQHLESSISKRKDGKKLTDFADLILDTGAPIGDSMIYIDGLETPVSPGSTVGGVMIVNSIKAELAKLMMDAGRPPKVLTAGAIVGSEKAAELFEAAYDEHGRMLGRLLSM
ncbi:MAG: hypothetical protein RLZZ546_815 [Bacteroidota bacterium]